MTVDAPHRPTDRLEWVGAIETISGRPFDILDPKPEQVSLYDIAHSLAFLCRFNGHVPTFYSVAEHCLRVAEWLEERNEPAEVVLTGLLHDASEAYVGDMTRPLKRTEQMAAYVAAEERVQEVISQALGGLYPYPDIVHEADIEVYRWEVENIRGRKKIGWLPGRATALYVFRYGRLTELAAKEASA